MENEQQSTNELHDRLEFCSKILEKCGCMHTKYWTEQLNKVQCELRNNVSNHMTKVEKE